jgi:hypothetical protein
MVTFKGNFKKERCCRKGDIGLDYGEMGTTIITEDMEDMDYM